MMETKNVIKCKHLYFLERLTDSSNLLKIAVCECSQELAQLLTAEVYEIFRENAIKGGS